MTQEQAKPETLTSQAGSNQHRTNRSSSNGYKKYYHSIQQRCSMNLFITALVFGCLGISAGGGLLVAAFNKGCRFDLLFTAVIVLLVGAALVVIAMNQGVTV